MSKNSKSSKEKSKTETGDKEQASKDFDDILRYHNEAREETEQNKLKKFFNFNSDFFNKAGKPGNQLKVSVPTGLGKSKVLPSGSIQAHGRRIRPQNQSIFRNPVTSQPGSRPRKVRDYKEKFRTMDDDDEIVIVDGQLFVRKAGQPDELDEFRIPTIDQGYFEMTGEEEVSAIEIEIRNSSRHGTQLNEEAYIIFNQDPFKGSFIFHLYDKRNEHFEFEPIDRLFQFIKHFKMSYGNDIHLNEIGDTKFKTLLSRVLYNSGSFLPIRILLPANHFIKTPDTRWKIQQHGDFMDAVQFMQQSMANKKSPSITPTPHELKKYVKTDVEITQKFLPAVITKIPASELVQPTGIECKIKNAKFNVDEFIKFLDLDSKKTNSDKNSSES